MTDTLYDKGLSVRRAVLGDEYVDMKLASATEFDKPLGELVTTFGWGAVWGRDGLDRRTRSLINLAMLSSLNRPHELALHVKGAVANGCSVEEIREALLQVAAYCGLPAAIDAFKVARNALEEIGALETSGGDAARAPGDAK